MGIGRTRLLAGPVGCQAVINTETGEKCHREDNATVHRQNFGMPGHKYHEYVPPTEVEADSE